MTTTASPSSQSVPHALHSLGCSQHSCMMTCAANAFGILLTHLAAIPPDSIQSHGDFCPPGLFASRSCPSPPPVSGDRCDYSRPVASPHPMHPPDRTAPWPEWDQWLSDVVPPDHSEPNSSAPVSATGPCTRTIGTQTPATRVPMDTANPETAQPTTQSAATPPATDDKSCTAAELVQVISSQERTILDLESKCEALTEQLKLAQQQNKERFDQLSAELTQALQDRAVAASSAHDASVAAGEALNAVSSMYQQVAAVASSIQPKRSKRSRKASAMSPHPFPTVSQASANGPPDPFCSTTHGLLRPAQSTHDPQVSPANPSIASPVSTSTLSSPWGILEPNPSPVPVSTRPPTSDSLCATSPPCPPLSTARPSSQHPPTTLPTHPPPGSPPLSTFTRAYWPASATLGLGLAQSKPGTASHLP
ncbi:hypothetical protein BCR44DRAFT_1436486, partial [Catenaria anguillulae PL171]